MTATPVVRRTLWVLAAVLAVFVAGTTATGSPWQVWSWGLVHLLWSLWALARLRRDPPDPGPLAIQENCEVGSATIGS